MENAPKKIYLEPTTRCNLHCRMCVKYAPGSKIDEQDLNPALFAGLLPALPHAERLIINGIGEPLLHPQLETLISLARTHLQPHGGIGLQSNGVLIDRKRAETLLQAGLDTLCLSLDSLVDPPPLNGALKEHSFAAVSRAVAALTATRQATGAALRIGLETVIHRDNYRHLPDIVDWAGNSGVDFIIVTHLFYYAPSPKSVFNPNSTDAIALFQAFRQHADDRNLNLSDCLNIYRRFDRSPAAAACREMLHTMYREAAACDLRLHPTSLIDCETHIDTDETAAAFARAKESADTLGLELSLPPLTATAERSCPFVDEGATFVAANGRVMPCHFLWHAYSCRVFDKEVAVQPRSFGSLAQRDILAIWRSDDYRRFRDEAGRYDYAHCWSCPQGPCPDLVQDAAEFANDCYGSTVPCGHCQWSLGGIRCLS
ncbi:radical SAM/SPASM family putative metalloenzyme maturase [bacterium]|nr:radical SAM/SPASM family putative metalloenzyme maturase [bacterium]